MLLFACFSRDGRATHARHVTAGECALKREEGVVRSFGASAPGRGRDGARQVKVRVTRHAVECRGAAAWYRPRGQRRNPVPLATPAIRQIVISASRQADSQYHSPSHRRLVRWNGLGPDKRRSISRIRSRGPAKRGTCRSGASSSYRAIETHLSKAVLTRRIAHEEYFLRVRLAEPAITPRHARLQTSSSKLRTCGATSIG